MANKSVLELAVETGKWDAGLKKAKSALDKFTDASGGLQKALDADSDKMGKFVQMMGKADSTAKTGKGQMNDYKQAIEQLTMQFNRMTDAQKKTVGQDYLNAIKKLKEKYRGVSEEIQEMNRSLTQSPQSGGAGGGIGGLFGGGKMSGMLQVFGGNLMTKAAGWAADFASEMGQAVQQGIELARQGEGIRIAFERLGRGDILDGLREATHGTVTDLELMKAAVKFNDFQLPLEELGTMLAFAQQKAKDTGQSVDYMVDSIVTGLGRKSLMILDNLGLSAAQIKDKMAETGDMTKAVGAIIREQMASAGDYIETAADRAAQANVNMQNKMEELGRKFGPIEEASNQLWTSMKIAILDVVGGPLARLLQGLTEAGRMQRELANINSSTGTGQTHSAKTLGMLKHYSGDKQDLYNRQVGRYNELESNAWRQANNLRAQLANLRRQQMENGAAGNLSPLIADVTKELERAEATARAWQKIRQEYQAGAKQILKPAASGGGGTGGNSLTSLSNKLKELRKLRDQAVEEGDIAARDMYNAQIKSTQEQIKNLRGTTTPKKQPKVKKTDYEKLKDKTSTYYPEFSIFNKVFNEEVELPFKVSLKKQSPEELKAELDKFTPKDPYELPVKVDFKIEEFLKKDAEKKLSNMQTAAQMAADAVSNLGAAFASIEDPSAKAAGTVMQAIASIALGFATASTQANTAGSGWGWLAWVAAGAAAMATTISTIHSLTGFEHGGEIKGNSFSGDNTPIMANAGEVVLTRAQAGNVAAQLQGSGNNVHVTGELRGESIFLAVNRSLKRRGKGELVTWG